MDIKDAMGLLQMRREEVIDAIEKGISLPSGEVVRLDATQLPTEKRERVFDITETDLDTFISAFEAEEPGRHPPADVRRTLLVEALHKCGICRQEAPRFDFHHIVEFARLRHHDPKHMISICTMCHVKCGNGDIDQKAQRAYKLKLSRGMTDRGSDPLFGDGGPIRFNWDDLRDVIVALGDILNAKASQGESRFDFSLVELEKKNELNRLGEEYFAMMRDHHEPHFHRIDEFLKNPMNSETTNLYHQLVDELRSQVAAGAKNFDSFERLLNHLRLTAIELGKEELKDKRAVLNVLLSYMYFNCDIGRKK